MKIIAVDDERLALQNLTGLLKKIKPDSEIIGFLKSSEAFSYLKKTQVDIVVLDIQMSSMNGIELAKKCQEICPNINIIFVTGHSEYAIDAWKLHASGYVMKPVREEDLRLELENLRFPFLDNLAKKVRIQAFGNFEVFVGGRGLTFPRKKSKECLAYLVDRRGAQVSVRELAAVIWEDRQYDRQLQNNTQTVLSGMMQTLRAEKAEGVIIKKYNSMAIDTGNVDCDYYEFLEKRQGWLFNGEYMSQYSWAEYTLGALMQGWAKKQ